MGALPAMETPILGIAHLVRIPAPEHLVHSCIVVALIIARIDAFKPVPVLDKDLLEEVPVLRGRCHHQGAPSWGMGDVCGAAFLPRLIRLVHPLIGLHRRTFTPSLTLEPRGLQASHKMQIPSMLPLLSSPSCTFFSL